LWRRIEVVVLALSQHCLDRRADVRQRWSCGSRQSTAYPASNSADVTNQCPRREDQLYRLREEDLRRDPQGDEDELK
jgi:hypothetical protein